MWHFTHLRDLIWIPIGVLWTKGCKLSHTPHIYIHHQITFLSVTTVFVTLFRLSLDTWHSVRIFCVNIFVEVIYFWYYIFHHTLFNVADKIWCTHFKSKHITRQLDQIVKILTFVKIVKIVKSLKKEKHKVEK